MMPSFAVRAKIGTLLLVVAGLVLSIRYTAQSALLDTPPIGGDPASLHEARFAGLKGVLPPDITVGYISPDKITPANVEAINEYELTQYDLAPVYVDQSTDHALVVGNFYRGPISFPPPDARHWRVVLNLGNGVVLFRRQTQ